MRDLVYPPVITAVKGLFAGMGLRFDLRGTEHVPRQGGGVIACNHVSYLDFALLGYGALPARRYIRFMAKESVFRHRVSGPLMRGMRHIPVDREAGSAAFKQALGALKGGELVGVFPEATISRSFQLKEFRPGAVKLAQASGTPLVPAVVWGGQRIFSKGTPKDFRGRGKAITVAFGEPVELGRGPAGPYSEELVRRMAALLEQVQQDYPDSPSGPQDRWWLPAAMGGTAPTPQEAAEVEAAERAARRSASGWPEESGG